MCLEEATKCAQWFCWCHVFREVQLKCVKRRAQLSETNRVARLTRCKQLLKRYSDPAVDFICFTDEKVFTVEPPFNSQNDMRQLEPRSNTSISALNIQHIGYGVRCRVTNGYDWTDICRPWDEGERPVLPRCLTVSADASSNQALRHIAPATPSSPQDICIVKMDSVILDLLT